MTNIRIDLARPEAAEVFGSTTVPALLRVLAATPGREYALTELIARAGVTSNDAAQRAVAVLLQAGLIHERREGRRRLLRIEEEALASPSEPLLVVPPRFRDAVRYAVDELERRCGRSAPLWKVLLFGGLALGRGDRLSDMDVLVVTPSPRVVRLEGSKLADELRELGFRGERYRLHLLAETPEGLRARKADPALPALLRQAVRLRDDPAHPLEDLLPEVP
jgi:predicted nucleotidyltransferase